MTFDEFEMFDIVQELAKVLGEREQALTLLVAIGFPPARVPAFAGFSSPMDYWRLIWEELKSDVLPDGPARLVVEAARLYPGNLVFTTLAGVASTAAIDDELLTVRTAVITIAAGESDEAILQIVSNVQRIAAERGVQLQPELALRAEPGSSGTAEAVHGGHRGNVAISTSSEALPDDEQVTVQSIADAFEAQSLRSDVFIRSVKPRDYFLDPLYVQGPEGTTYSVEHVLASTRVSELARNVVGNYDADVWPADRAGQRPAVVNCIDPATGGCRRLRGDQTLHESGVKPHDTLSVQPEAVAGGGRPAPERRVLEVALQDKLVEQHAYPVLVLLRLLSSEPLLGRLLVRGFKADPDVAPVASSAAHMRYAPDVREAVVVVTVSGADFQCDSPRKRVRVNRGRDSPILRFDVKPREIGLVGIAIEVTLDRISIATEQIWRTCVRARTVEGSGELLEERRVHSVTVAMPGRQRDETEQDSAERRLHDLLMSIFRTKELIRWIRVNFGEAWANLLPSDQVSINEMAFAVMDIGTRQGRIDHTFFERLRIDVPHQEVAICNVSHAWRAVWP